MVAPRLGTLVCFVFLWSLKVTSQQEKQRKRVLSFGGNGMIGSATLSLLIQAEEEYDIVMVSRGSWPFDSEELIAPHVQSILCDRDEGLKTCDDLVDEIESTSEYHAVLDFSGFSPEWVEDAVLSLKGKVRVYVYVSTDSVYEVTELPPYSQTGKKSVETDAIRPAEEQRRESLREFDEYGDDKLAGEEVLVEQRGDGNEGFPYVALRFADVIGPRDGSDRFVTYYAWIKFADTKELPPITVPENVLETTSFTYSGNAADSIIAAMDTPSAWDEAYNVAGSGVFNVTSSIITMGHIMGRHKLEIKRADRAPGVYPSITKGPIDIHKATSMLNFKATHETEALRRTIAWFEQQYSVSEDFREYVVNELGYIIYETQDFETEEEREDFTERVMAGIQARDEL